jgi:hypothetical protein
MPGTVLAYGSTISNGSVACRSESVFLACAHLASGNGFVIARAIFHTYGTVQTATRELVTVPKTSRSA